MVKVLRNVVTFLELWVSTEENVKVKVLGEIACLNFASENQATDYFCIVSFYLIYSMHRNY